MVDKIFTFSEVGAAEVETQSTFSPREFWKGERSSRWSGGWQGIPNALFARWGQGDGPVDLLTGATIDGIPKANPEAWSGPTNDPLVEVAPGHGEGHNSGQR